MKKSDFYFDLPQEHGKTYEEIISFYYTGAYVA